MSAVFSVEDLKKKLQKGQYKLTHQRKVVLDVFVKNPDKHLSAEDVYAILKTEEDDNIGLATVYRTLELLCDSQMDVLQKIDFGEGCYRYELNTNEPNTHQHHHLICTQCRNVIEFEEDMLDVLEKDIFNKCKFMIKDHQVKFFGLCEECQKKFAD